MARYIDADKLIEKWQNTLKDKSPDDLDYKCFTLFIDGLKKEPTADVVPKSEIMHVVGACYDKCEECRTKIANAVVSMVAREIFEEIEKDGKYAISFVENHKSYSEEVRQAKLECYKDIQNYITELKKKYTESEGKDV